MIPTEQPASSVSRSTSSVPSARQGETCSVPRADRSPAASHSTMQETIEAETHSLPGSTTTETMVRWMNRVTLLPAASYRTMTPTCSPATGISKDRLCGARTRRRVTQAIAEPVAR